jgi:replication-associated recombination protein RarA
MEVKKSSAVENKFVKMLIYGPAGIGKTRFCSTANKPLFLDCEGGLLSVIDKDVDYIPIKEWKSVQDVFLELITGKLDYDTIIIDSLTELSKKSMDAILGNVQQGQTNAVGSKIIPNQHDWLMNIEEVRRCVRAFRDLDKNIIMTCLQRDEKNELSGGITRKPSVSAKSLADDIVGYFDEVFFMEMDKEGKRWFLTQPYKTQQGYSVYAKDRSGKLDTFEKPDFMSIYNKIVATKNNKEE